MEDCFPDKRPYILIFFGVLTGVWALIGAVLLLARSRGRPWLASCDITMDVSLSRAFTVSGTLWLLYFFYRFTTDFLKVGYALLSSSKCADSSRHAALLRCCCDAHVLREGR